MQRFSSTAGIAIGPILFMLAILGVLAMTMSSSVSSFGTAGVADRVTADVVSQANLIRSKINECNLMYGTNSNGDGWPASDPTDGTLVSALECEADPAGQKSLWSGLRAALLPPPTKGFNAWYYMNAGAEGGRCIWTAPTSSSSGVVAGLTQAATKFSSQEVDYDSSSEDQKFVIFLTPPTGTANAHCAH